MKHIVSNSLKQGTFGYPGKSKNNLADLPGTGKVLKALLFPSRKEVSLKRQGAKVNKRTFLTILIKEISIMSYEKKISRGEPGLIVMVLDDSGSMAENLPGTTDPKFKWVERYVGILLKECLGRSTEVKGETVVVKPRYFLVIIIYGSEPQMWGSGEMDIQAAVEKYTNDGNSLRLGGKLGGTDAEAAFQTAYDYLKQAVTQDRFKNSFPPMVFHLTDGESQTDATPIAENIKNLSIGDGNVLIVNAYVGTQTSLNYKGPEDFTGYMDVSEAGPGDDNIRLFNMSSQAPACIHQNLVDDGIFANLRKGSRLFFDVRTKEMLKHTIQVVGSLGSRADRTMR
jgi:hypothetical protein